MRISPTGGRKTSNNATAIELMPVLGSDSGNCVWATPQPGQKADPGGSCRPHV